MDSGKPSLRNRARIARITPRKRGVAPALTTEGDSNKPQSVTAEYRCRTSPHACFSTNSGTKSRIGHNSNRAYTCRTATSTSARDVAGKSRTSLPVISINTNCSATALITYQHPHTSMAPSTVPVRAQRTRRPASRPRSPGIFTNSCTSPSSPSRTSEAKSHEHTRHQRYGAATCGLRLAPSAPVRWRSRPRRSLRFALRPPPQPPSRVSPSPRQPPNPPLTWAVIIFLTGIEILTWIRPFETD